MGHDPDNVVGTYVEMHLATATVMPPVSSSKAAGGWAGCVVVPQAAFAESSVHCSPGSPHPQLHLHLHPHLHLLLSSNLLAYS